MWDLNLCMAITGKSEQVSHVRWRLWSKAFQRLLVVTPNCMNVSLCAVLLWGQLEDTIVWKQRFNGSMTYSLKTNGIQNRKSKQRQRWRRMGHRCNAVCVCSWHGYHKMFLKIAVLWKVKFDGLAVGYFLIYMSVISSLDWTSFTRSVESFLNINTFFKSQIKRFTALFSDNQSQIYARMLANLIWWSSLY